MIEGPIVQDQEFRHMRNGNVYTVLMANHDGSQVTTTEWHAGTGEWVACVVYYDGGLPGRTFVRDEADFRAKFERAS